MKILVANDSIVSRSLLSAVLKKWGYEVFVVSDGNEAWNLLQTNSQINLAIIDWIMPGLTGIDLCRKVREEIDTLERYVYTILLTSKARTEELIMGFESGADDYVRMPFDQQELYVRLRAGQRILKRLGFSVEPLQPIRFYSCFISYSSVDEEFVKRLHSDLTAHNISSWYAPEDLKIGDRFRFAIDESIRLHDKLLLILSRASIMSRWVEAEVEAALEDEQRRIANAPEHLRGNATILFPIRIDDAPFQAADGWVAEVKRTRHIGDFTRWRNPQSYQDSLRRLLRDLAMSDELDKRAEENRRRLADAGQ